MNLHWSDANGSFYVTKGLFAFRNNFNALPEQNEVTYGTEDNSCWRLKAAAEQLGVYIVWMALLCTAKNYQGKGK